MPQQSPRRIVEVLDDVDETGPVEQLRRLEFLDAFAPQVESTLGVVPQVVYNVAVVPGIAVVVDADRPIPELGQD